MKRTTRVFALSLTAMLLVFAGATSALADHKAGHQETPSCDDHPNNGGPQNKHCEAPAPAPAPVQPTTPPTTPPPTTGPPTTGQGGPPAVVSAVAVAVAVAVIVAAVAVAAAAVPLRLPRTP